MMQISASDPETIVHLVLDVTESIRQYLTETHSGYLAISSGSVTWFVYIDRGQLLYLTHSVEPTDRLDCHLRGLSRQVPSISTDVRTQIRLSMAPDTSSSPDLRPDFKGICDSIKDSILSPEAAKLLATDLSREALESLLMVQTSSLRFVPVEQSYPRVEPLDFNLLLEECRARIQSWQDFNSHIWSPYQRPYRLSQSQSGHTLVPETQPYLDKILCGFSFRHLAILLDQDELQLVKSLYSLILDKQILLRDPQPPYSDLPSFYPSDSQELDSNFDHFLAKMPESDSIFNLASQASVAAKAYRVACIDSSASMLQTMERFLGQENCSLFLIQDSVKALIELMQIKPDLILLDAGMPKVDGYELCRLLRKHVSFKSTPIILVTESTGLIDRAKAKVSGATDYLTKPFTQTELSKIVFHHLT